MSRAAWIVAYTIVEPDQTMTDRWEVFATRREAYDTAMTYALADNVRFCVYGQMKGSTETHWLLGDV